MIDDMAASTIKHQNCKAIFVTGPPGIGKTTLIRNIVSMLSRDKISYHGFITEEVRKQGYRVGFDAISVASDDVQCAETRVALARVEEAELSAGARLHASSARPQVGKYLVDIPSFEKLMLAALHPSTAPKRSVVVIDEIGKMELFSQRFKDSVISALSNPDSIVLATVPIKPNPFVDHLRKKYQVNLFTVTHSNRDRLNQDILNAITNSK